MRFSLEEETKLIEFSLRQGRGRKIIEQDKILIVSANEADMKNRPQTNTGPVPAPTADAYAEIIEKLGQTNVQMIVIAWDSEAHKDDDFTKMVTAASIVSKNALILIAVEDHTNPGLPSDLLQFVTPVDNFPCNLADQVQSTCTYGKTWTFWVIQKIFDELGEKDQTHPKVIDGEREHEAPSWTSMQFPSSFPTYILNLSDPNEFLHLTFDQLAKGPTSQNQFDLTPYTMAFVGTQLDHSKTADDDLPLVKTVYNEKGLKRQESGTPFHIYWAQIAQMYMDKAMVRIPPNWAIYLISGLFCGFICLILWLFGGPASLGMFLVYVSFGPFVNALALSRLNVYLPLFDSYYFGIATFIIAGFARLSYSAFQNWRLEEQKKIHSHTADLKGNFISLLSHNLNTPVAKMQGMLELLNSQPSMGDWKEDVHIAESGVSQLEFSIRSVLVASALEENSVNESSRNLKKIVEEFSDSMISSLRRLGITVEVVIDDSEDDELPLIPLHFDMRALNAGLAAMCGLFAKEGQRIPIKLSFKVVYREAEDGYPDTQLQITISSAGSWLNPTAIGILAADRHRTIRSAQGEDFFQEVQAGLIRQLAVTYRGTVKMSPKGRGGMVHLALHEYAVTPSGEEN